MFENSKLSRQKLSRVVECFCLDIDATKTASLLRLNRKTVNRYFGLFRECIRDYQISERKRAFSLEPPDESFFAHIRRPDIDPDLPSGHPENGAIFGLYELGGRVFTERLPSLPASLPAGADGMSAEHSLEIALLGGYDGFVRIDFDRQLRINRAKHGNTLGGHVMQVEAFWSFAKRRLAKFNGVRRNFDLHLKECEWRYSKSPEQLRRELRGMMRK